MRKLAVFISLFVSLALCAQRFTINGYVEDAASGERLIGATVYDTVSHLGAITNAAGFYTLSLPQNQVAVQVSYVGYHPSAISTFSLVADTLMNVRIRSNTRLDEVVVVGNKSISGPESVQMSAIEVPVNQIMAIPAIAGEVDVIKALQLLPGVQSGIEGSAGLYVRGGGPDENLILLDGVPLYNVNHLMGFFSVFNADAIKNVTLYKGNFPSQYGGRLSSIIDVRQNDGSTTGYHGGVSIGLLAIKLNFEGFIPHKHDSTGSTTFNVSARRTYFDAFTTPLMALISSINSNNNQRMSAGAYFYDVNAKLTHTFANNDDRLSASFYIGDDAMYVNLNEYDNRVFNTGMDMNMCMTWGNIIAALNWEHRYNARLFSNIRAAYTQYRYRLSEEMEQRIMPDNSPKLQTFNQKMGYNSQIRDVSLTANYDWTPLPNNELHFGAEYTYHQFRPEVSNFFIYASNQASLNMDTLISDGTLHGHEASLYIEDSYSPWSWLKMNLGVRASLYNIDGKLYPSIEPRASLRAILYKDLAFKASYSYTTQYIHMLSNSSVSLPTDLWVPVTKHIAPMHSMIVAAGLTYDVLGQCEISLEGYYKRQTNLLEYMDGASFFGSAASWQDKVVMGDGWSYGIEFLVQRKVGPVTGWVGYTWARTMRQFNREGQLINDGLPFPAKYDREHDLSITLQYQVTNTIDIAATFVYGTGTRATLATQVYYDPTVSDMVDYVEKRNNYKMPDYHRLDLGANFHFPHRNKNNRAWLSEAEHVLSTSIYNVYCHANPYMMIPRNNVLKQVSLFPILPSISYAFKF